MFVLGYRSGADFEEASKIIKKHTNMSLSDAKKLCAQVREGKSVTLPNDFVLREDLEECKFILS